MAKKQAEKKAEQRPEVMLARDIIGELSARGISDLMIAERVRCAYVSILNWSGRLSSRSTVPAVAAHRENLANLYREVTGKSVTVSADQN